MSASVTAADHPRTRRVSGLDLSRLEAFRHLPGLWTNVWSTAKRGWNIMALPFADPDSSHDYRLLINHYEEELRFSFVDDDVPNRGLSRRDSDASQLDQFVIALDYQQTVRQLKAVDFPASGVAGGMEAIHHEPGLFLRMINQTTDELTVARLATVPHGNSLTALGRWRSYKGGPEIPDAVAFPVGVVADPPGAVGGAEVDDYLYPFRHFVDNPFLGDIDVPYFPGFSPDNANRLLQLSIPSNVVRTTEIHFDTTVEQAGIVNIPFIVKQAEPTSMTSTFWVMELAYGDVWLAYSQTVMLEFAGRRDGRPGRIQWPHISINLMTKVAEPNEADPYMVNVEWSR